MSTVKELVYYGVLTQKQFNHPNYTFGTGTSNSPFLSEAMAKKAVKKELSRPNMQCEDGWVEEYILTKVRDITL